MQQKLGRLAGALVALAFAAGLGAAHAAVGEGGFAQQQDAPKDCKKNPNDARCKDGK